MGKHKVHHKHPPRVKAGQKYRNDPTNPEAWKCGNCGRRLQGPRQLCRKLKGCPGRIRERLLRGEEISPDPAKAIFAARRTR